MFQNYAGTKVRPTDQSTSSVFLNQQVTESDVIYKMKLPLKYTCTFQVTGFSSASTIFLCVNTSIKFLFPFYSHQNKSTLQLEYYSASNFCMIFRRRISFRSYFPHGLQNLSYFYCGKNGENFCILIKEIIDLTKFIGRCMRDEVGFWVNICDKTPNLPC